MNGSSVKFTHWMGRGAAVLTVLVLVSCAGGSKLADDEAPAIDKETQGLVGETKELGVLTESGTAASAAPLAGASAVTSPTGDEPQKIEGLLGEPKTDATKEIGTIPTEPKLASNGPETQPLPEGNAGLEPLDVQKEIASVPSEPVPAPLPPMLDAPTEITAPLAAPVAEAVTGDEPMPEPAKRIVPKVKRHKTHGARRHAKVKAAPAVAPETPAPIVTSYRTPAVPQTAVAVNGALMNRYYFLRKDEGADRVSQFFYGTTDRAQDLAAWNAGKKWEAGTLVVYQSPKVPADTQVRSFYEENGVRSRQHTVRQGDTLPSLAKEEYRDEQSWAEIAALNHLKDGRAIQPGEELALMPENLAAFAAPAAPKGVAQGQGLGPVLPTGGSPSAKADDKKNAQLAGTDVTPFFMRHVGLSIVLAAAVLFVAALLLRRTRRSGDEIDF